MGTIVGIGVGRWLGGPQGGIVSGHIHDDDDKDEG